MAKSIENVIAYLTALVRKTRGRGDTSLEVEHELMEFMDLEPVEKKAEKPAKKARPE